MLWSDWPRAESMAPVMPAARRPQAPGRQADRQPRPDHPGRRSKRDHADHDPRDRGDHRRKDSGPHRTDRPVPRPGPLRLLRRRRPDRSLLRAGPKAPAVQARQPPAQQCFARRRDHPATPPRPGPRLLREEDHRGKTTGEARRALKRHLADLVYATIVVDAQRSPRGQVGASTKSSAAGQTPRTSTSDKSLPGLHQKATTAVA